MKAKYEALELKKFNDLRQSHEEYKTAAENRHQGMNKVASSHKYVSTFTKTNNYPSLGKDDYQYEERHGWVVG